MYKTYDKMALDENLVDCPHVLSLVQCLIKSLRKILNLHICLARTCQGGGQAKDGSGWMMGQRKYILIHLQTFNLKKSLKY